MSTGGLSRRRVGGGDQSSESTSTSPTTAAGPSSEPKKPTNGQQNAYNDSQPSGSAKSSHKVGYDPRDMDDQDEEKLNPKLTLMEEVLLMGLKDKQVPFFPLDWFESSSSSEGLSVFLE